MINTLERDGLTFRAHDCPQLPEFWEDYRVGWECGTTNLLRRLLKPGSIFIDVGAWIGPHTLYAAALGARVVAVEPDPVALEALAGNLTLNQYEDVSVWPGAVVVDRDGGMHLRPLEAFGDSMSFLAYDGGTPVEAWTLPEILMAEQIDPGEVALIKIDVEGYEARLMEELGPWLASCGVPIHLSYHGTRVGGAWQKPYSMTDLVELAVSAGRFGTQTFIPRKVAA